MSEKKKILILSTINNLVPRVKLEKETLEKKGNIVDVVYRNQISWNIKTFVGMVRYYGNVLRHSQKKNVKIVHLTHISQIPISPILKLMRKKVVYDAYERYSLDISEKHFNGIFKKPAKFLIELFENSFVYFFIDAVLVVSTPDEYLRDRYLNYCKLTECLFNVPPLLSVFRGNLNNKFSVKPLKVVYIGALGSEKGSRVFIRLAKEMKKIMLDWEMHLIISVGRKSEMHRLLLEIENSELSDLVKVHNYMEYNNMIRFLYTSHIGLNLTSNTKRLSHVGIGSSRKNFTYMSAGMAVITTEVGQMAYATKYENCGVIINDLENIRYLASVIEELNHNRQMAITYARNGIEAISNKYNWENEQDKLLRIYRQLE
jgi:glycosyltransferase involved in cell wall biosynthesis